jgi:hypothetical protein
MISKAASEGLLLPLSRRAFKHRISMYADDVVLFLCPIVEDIEITMYILSLFGDATGLKTNLQKINVLLIKCENTDYQMSRLCCHVLLRISHANILGYPSP